MAQLFRTFGRLTGKALKSHAFEKVLAKSAVYLRSEMRLVDIRLKLKMLTQKRARHLRLLGKTVYRLTLNDIDPMSDEHIQTITRVLREIDIEIGQVTSELERGKQYEKQKKTNNL